jgi:beta-mannanase
VVGLRVSLQATRSSLGANQLTRLTMTSVTNARVEMLGASITVPSSIAIATEQTSFVLNAIDPSQGFLLQFSVSDRCGEIQKFVGFGSTSNNTTSPTSTPTAVTPTSSASPTPSSSPTASPTASPTPTSSPTVAPPATPTNTAGPTATPTGGQVAFGTYRNVFPNDLSSVASYEQATGKQMTIIHWYALWGGWKHEFSRADLEVVDRRGSIPMITWEPWAGVPNDPVWSLRAGILSGRHDAYIESWARGMAAYGKPVLLRFAHEMHNQPAYPWALDNFGNTASDYLAAWRHVRNIFDRNGANNVAWVWNPNTMGESSAASYAPIYRALYPGDAYVDWVGLDLYNTGPRLDWGAPYWRSFASVASEPYAAVTALTNKPLVLGEVGSAETGGDKARWISEGLGPSLVQQFPRVRAIVWFDINKEESWAVQSSSSSRAAFVAALRQRQFMASAAELVPVLANREPSGPPSDVTARIAGALDQ